MTGGRFACVKHHHEAVVHPAGLADEVKLFHDAGRQVTYQEDDRRCCLDQFLRHCFPIGRMSGQHFRVIAHVRQQWIRTTM